MWPLLIALCVMCSLPMAKAGDEPDSLSYIDVANKRIIGPLGIALGEYLTIEGRPCSIGKIRTVTYLSAQDIVDHGLNRLEVQKVNGKELKPPVIIRLGCAEQPKYAPANWYVIRGYQHGEFGGENPDLEDPTRPTVQASYHFSVCFVPTKDLTKHKAKDKQE